MRNSNESHAFYSEIGENPELINTNSNSNHDDLVITASRQGSGEGGHFRQNKAILHPSVYANDPSITLSKVQPRR